MCGYIKLIIDPVDLGPNFSLDTMDVGLTPGIHSLANSTYRQTVTIELLRNLHAHGKIMFSVYGDEEHEIPKKKGSVKLTVQDVIEWIAQRPFYCLDVCVDRRLVRTTDTSTSTAAATDTIFRITTIGPLQVSTKWSRNVVYYETRGNKFCIKYKYMDGDTCYEYGISIERLTHAPNGFL